MKKLPVEPDSVFLNIPYDIEFQDLYLAYIAGLTQLGLTPRATLAIPGGAARLDRIIDLIASCKYSIHDLSRVEMDETAPPTPRFNMPLELGLTITWARLHSERHTWSACESMERRALKSVSDLNGTDFNVHQANPEGVMRELLNMFVRRSNRPSVPTMMKVYRRLKLQVPDLLAASGSVSVFNATVFNDLIAAAASIA